MGFVGIVAEFLLVAQGGATHVGHDYALPIPRILLGTDPAKPLILLAQIAFWGLKSRNRESRNRARESGRDPPLPHSATPTAPPRAYAAKQDFPTLLAPVYHTLAFSRGISAEFNFVNAKHLQTIVFDLVCLAINGSCRKFCDS